MDWTFTGYDKIPASTTRWDADAATMRRLTKLRWVATEKIHGASFCFVLDANDIRCASRRSLIEADDAFFGYAAVRARYAERLTLLHRSLSASWPDCERFLVYGELFGGHYPHPDVPPTAGVQAVQTGVWYCPEVDFSAFDVARVCDGARIWLPVSEALDRLRDAGVPFCEPLLIGPLGDMMAMSVEFTTKVPGDKNLPPLPDNLAEGIVIKPMSAFVLETGKAPIRPVIKRKHPRFDEDDRFHAATRWSKPVVPLGNALDTLEWAVMRRANANRIASARSKLGPQASDAAMSEEVCGDVWVDVIEENPAAVAGLSGEDRALLDAVLCEEVAALLTGG
ncbi:MAG: Rnl2 family RNA ligase [Myxococcota bacterium]|jgi:Rnl2 family RNA ligase